MIVGFTIKLISAERKAIPKGRIDINSSPKIVSISQAESSFMQREKPLNIEFEFLTKYEPKVGEIKIIGNIFYIGKDMKKILEVWGKDKKISKELEVEIKNFLFRKCLTIGVNLSENMQLPPPLMFPTIIPKKIQKKSQNPTYIG